MQLEASGLARETDLLTGALWTGLDELSVPLTDLYRELHQHPELSLRQHRTAQRVAGALRRRDFEVTEQIGGTGVVGLLRNGDGPVVMLVTDHRHPGPRDRRPDWLSTPGIRHTGTGGALCRAF